MDTNFWLAAGPVGAAVVTQVINYAITRLRGTNALTMRDRAALETEQQNLRDEAKRLREEMREEIKLYREDNRVLAAKIDSLQADNTTLRAEIAQIRAENTVLKHFEQRCTVLEAKNEQLAEHNQQLRAQLTLRGIALESA